jgi:HEAT repeat protein
MKSVIPDIIERLKDSDSDARQAAMDTIGQLAKRGR